MLNGMGRELIPAGKTISARDSRWWWVRQSEKSRSQIEGKDKKERLATATSSGTLRKSLLVLRFEQKADVLSFLFLNNYRR